MEHNLYSPRVAPPIYRCSSGRDLLCFGKTGASPPYPGVQVAVCSSRRLSVGAPRPRPSSPQGLMVRDAQESPSKQGLGSRLHSAPCLLEASSNCRHKIRKQHSDPSGQAGPLPPSPRLNELMHRSPLPTILGSPSKIMPPFEFPKTPSSSNLVTLLTHHGLVLDRACDRATPNRNEPSLPPGGQAGPCFGRLAEESKGMFGRSLSTGRLSDLLLKAAFGPPLVETDRSEAFTPHRAQDAVASPGGSSSDGGAVTGSGSPVRAVFTVGSPPHGSTPPQTVQPRMFCVSSSGSPSSIGSLTNRHTLTGMCLDGYDGPSSLQRGFTGPAASSLEGAVTFEVPELPEETLMEHEQSEVLRSLRFTLAFAHCVAEIAGGKGSSAETGCPPPAPVLHQPQSLVADQISLLSRDWSYAEQLVLYMKTVELLSSALHTAMMRIRQGLLYPSATVKQVVRRLNDLYKASVRSCRCLGDQLQPFFQHKQQLMDRINSITAEKLIFNHTIQMVQSAALDEMFHQGGASLLQYRKALLLMDGLSLLITDQADALSITKCEYRCHAPSVTAPQPVYLCYWIRRGGWEEIRHAGHTSNEETLIPFAGVSALAPLVDSPF
ncbi:hypothetical protein GJAV_G00036650 [Gymnothorax javanicus]|nr:hypothetical protein GJAV_G00036650 [Gymnothorax javanicus]